MVLETNSLSPGKLKLMAGPTKPPSRFMEEPGFSSLIHRRILSFCTCFTFPSTHPINIALMLVDKDRRILSYAKLCTPRHAQARQHCQPITNVQPCNVGILPTPPDEGLFHETVCLHFVRGTSPSQTVRPEIEPGQVQLSQNAFEKGSKGRATAIPTRGARKAQLAAQLKHRLHCFQRDRVTYRDAFTGIISRSYCWAATPPH